MNGSGAGNSCTFVSSVRQLLVFSLPKPARRRQPAPVRCSSRAHRAAQQTEPARVLAPNERDRYLTLAAALEGREEGVPRNARLPCGARDAAVRAGIDTQSAPAAPARGHRCPTRKVGIEQDSYQPHARAEFRRHEKAVSADPSEAGSSGSQLVRESVGIRPAENPEQFGQPREFRMMN